MRCTTTIESKYIMKVLGSHVANATTTIEEGTSHMGYMLLPLERGNHLLPFAHIKHIIYKRRSMNGRAKKL